MPDNGRKFAVITGASSGIGLELARQFVENDFDALIVAEDPDIKSAADDLSANAAEVIPVQADLSTKEGVEETFRAIESTGRRVDALVLNAGVGNAGKFI